MDDPLFGECLEIARLIVGVECPDSTFGARHYHAEAMGFPADWGTRRQPVINIGAYHFQNDVD